MRLSGIAALIFVTLASRTASADDESKRRAEAEARFKEGNELYNAHKEDEAKIRFEQAYAIFPSPHALFMLARTEQLTNEPLKAHRHYRTALADPKLAEKTRKYATKYDEEVSKQLGHISISPKDVILVMLDGETVGVGEHDVLPGTHAVLCRFATGEARENISIAAGESKTVSLEAPPQPALQSSVNLPVVLPIESAPPVEPASTNIVPRVATATALLVGGIALTSIGVGYRFSASRDEDRRVALDLANPVCVGKSAACEELRAASDDRVKARNIGTGLIAGGIAVVGASVATWFLWPSESRPRTQTRIEPMVGPGFAAAQWSGSF